MARLDVPTLQCDRCKNTTQDKMEMMSFRQLSHDHMSGHDKWDLCKDCWALFLSFMGSPITYAEMYDGIKNALTIDKDFITTSNMGGNLSLVNRISYITATKALEIISGDRS